MDLLAAELSRGERIEMSHGRPIISGGRSVELGDRTGVIFQQSPEEEAFHRWQRKEFLHLERALARRWRNALSKVDLEENYRFFQRFFPLGKPKTFADVKRFVDFHIGGPDQEVLLRFGLSLLGVHQDSQEMVLTRWRDSRRATIREFAPYFTHVFSIELFFNLAIAADLIGRGRRSHKIDLAYLYYLPFCMVFTSNDKLHADITPFFLRENQQFVSGAELKADLGKLDAYYSALPEEVREGGVISFAFYPPLDNSFLVTRLWDKCMSPHWREDAATPKRPRDTEADKELLEEVRRLKEDARQISDQRKVSGDEAHYMMVERKVYVQKGKWRRFPPEVLDKVEKE
jgi:hypothetical protein